MRSSEHITFHHVVAEKAVGYRKVRNHSVMLQVHDIDSAGKVKLLLGHVFESKPIECMYAVALNSGVSGSPIIPTRGN